MEDPAPFAIPTEPPDYPPYLPLVDSTINKYHKKQIKLFHNVGQMSELNFLVRDRTAKLNGSNIMKPKPPTLAQLQLSSKTQLVESGLGLTLKSCGPIIKMPSREE